jgi:hypothetical protein
MERVLFQEEQKNSMGWMVIILCISLFSVLTPFAYGVYSQEVLHKPFGDNPISSGALILIGTIAVFVILGANYVILKMRLLIKITPEALWVSYPPLMRKWKKFTPPQIEKWEIRKYNGVREFGGYGLKGSIKNGSCYTVSGNEGLQLHLTGGKKLLIGTRKKQALEYAIRKMMNQELKE